MEETLGQEPRQQDDTPHAGSDYDHHEMVAKCGGAVGECLHDQPERHTKISVIKGDDRKFKHDLRDALRDATLRMVIGKDLEEDAAKGIDKAASLHLLKSRQLTQSQYT